MDSLQFIIGIHPHRRAEGNFAKNIKNNNIVVHCSAGVSRSGAVTEVGLFLGYELYNFSNLRTINKTVCMKIKKYIPIYKIIPATIKVWIAKIFNKQ